MICKFALTLESVKLATGCNPYYYNRVIEIQRGMLMGAQAIFLDRVTRCPVEHRHDPAALDAGDRQLLDTLRSLARRAGMAPRLDLDRACALIAPDPSEAKHVYGSTLLRALDMEATRSVVFYAGDTARPGFDELWLLRIVRLFQQGDDSGARFLIAGRIPPCSRRKIAFLALRFAQSCSLESF